MSYNIRYTTPTARRQNRSTEGLNLAQNEINFVDPPNVNIFPPLSWQREDVPLENSGSATIFRAPGIQITTSRNPMPRTTQNISFLSSQPGVILMSTENSYPSNAESGNSRYSPVVREALNMGFSIEQIEHAMSR